MNKLWAIVLVLAHVSHILASHGDDLYIFDDCLYQCEQLTCYNNPYHIVQEEFHKELQDQNFDFKLYRPDWHFDSMPLPLHLRLLSWTCEQNCDYQCQRIVTKDRIDEGVEEPVVQFHGKWPFRRILGVQELMSALFSIGNFVVHYIGFKKLANVIAKTPAKLRSNYYNVLLISVVTMGAWVSSTIFHIRDFPTTEKLDYYFAGATVLSSFHGIAARLMELHKTTLWRWVFFLVCILAFAGHIYRLETDWLYTYNMQANIAVGILQNICLGKLCFNIYSQYYREEQLDRQNQNLNHLTYMESSKMLLSSFYGRSPKLYSLYALFLASIVAVGLSLEVFDFPPVFFDLVDAHSLWHLVTIVPVYYGWYDWMIWDITENVVADLRAVEEKKSQ